MHKSATRCQNSWSMSNLPDATDPGGRKNGGPVLSKYEHNSRSPIPLWSARWTKFCMQWFFLDWLKWTKVQKIHAKKKVSAKKNCNQFQWLFWWWKYIFQISHDLEIFRNCFRKKHVGCISDLTWTCLRVQSEEPPKFENCLQFTTCQFAIDYLCFSETNHRLLKVSDDMCLLIESKRTTSTHRADWIKTS